MYNRKTVSVNDDNVLGSQMDSHERLWISANFEDVVMAVGVAYFPCDNIPSKEANVNSLQQELIQNIGEPENKFEKILLVGDFNEKVVEFRNAGKTALMAFFSRTY